jgi:hypothetical protein
MVRMIVPFVGSIDLPLPLVLASKPKMKREKRWRGFRWDLWLCFSSSRQACVIKY